MTMTVERSGFSLVEVIIAMLLLSLGVLAMGASTGYIMRQVRASELRTERAAVVTEAAERVRATAWDDLGTPCNSTTPLVARDSFRITCSVEYPSSNLARVELVSVGPGITSSTFNWSVADTFAISLAEPVQ